MHAGTDEQLAKLLPGIASGEEYWCTLYSEPRAGSDLASLETTAILDGDSFLVNGEKIWATAAHRADWGWLVARTDPEAPKHRGISTFYLDMTSPGITVHPMINLLGTHTSNRVTFENVRVPRGNLVGELNQGWNIGALLHFERSGIGRYAEARRDLEEYVAFAGKNALCLRTRLGVRHELAERWIEMEVGYAIAKRVIWLQEAGRSPTREAGISKVYVAELSQKVAQTGMNLLGLYGAIESGLHLLLDGRAARQYIRSLLSTIAGGTSEVSRNNLARAGVGMPRS
jgi:alkylation response protein AidB-like acyl-CoA dehydrogenase